MSEQPRLTVDNYGTFAEEYDNYFNDQLPFQNNLIKLNSLIDYFVFDRSANSKVIIGKYNWLFYDNKDDGDPIGCYQGKNDNLQERAGMVGLSIATLPEDYLKRIANGYIIGVHSCVEHFLVQYRLLPGSPARGQNYSAEDDDNRLKWILNICYGNRIPHDVKQLYFICNYYRLVRNEIVHCGTGRVELRQAKTELNNLTDDLAISNIRGHLNAPNNFTNLNFDDQVLFSRAARTICDRIYKDSKYDWDVVLGNYRTKINSFILSNDSEEKKKARILNFLSQMYPINVNDSRLIESISHFVV